MLSSRWVSAGNPRSSSPPPFPSGDWAAASQSASPRVWVVVFARYSPVLQLCSYYCPRCCKPVCVQTSEATSDPTAQAPRHPGCLNQTRGPGEWRKQTDSEGRKVHSGSLGFSFQPRAEQDDSSFFSCIDRLGQKLSMYFSMFCIDGTI